MKSLVVDVTALGNLPGKIAVPGKIEGLAVLNRQYIAVTNDNDFDLASFDAAGRSEPKGVPTRLFVIRLPVPLEAVPRERDSAASAAAAKMSEGR